MATMTKTATGVDVEVTPHGHEYCREPVAEVVLTFDHPDHGRCVQVARRWGPADRKGYAGSIGHMNLGVTGEIFTPTFRTRKYVADSCVTIDRATFDAVMAEARAQAEAAVAAAVAADATRDETAKAGCPAGYVACRQVWSNGDLAAACYRSEDGTEVVASDLLESHDGWYWIEAAKVDAARAKVAAKRADDESRAVRADAATAAAVAQARATGVRVEIARWAEECDGSAEECSTDLCVRYALPDGTTRVSRTHTH